MNSPSDANAASNDWPEPKMSHGLIGRLSRVVMDGQGEVALDLHECRAILQLDTAANLAVDFHAPKVKRDDEISKPMLALRRAVRRVP